MAARTKTVFVIMPFAEEFYPGFQDIIQPAIEKVGLECIRADKELQGYIQKQIIYSYFVSTINSLTKK